MGIESKIPKGLHILGFLIGGGGGLQPSQPDIRISRGSIPRKDPKHQYPASRFWCPLKADHPTPFYERPWGSSHLDSGGTCPVCLCPIRTGLPAPVRGAVEGEPGGGGAGGGPRPSNCGLRPPTAVKALNLKEEPREAYYKWGVLVRTIHGHLWAGQLGRGVRVTVPNFVSREQWEESMFFSPRGPGW